MNFVWGPFDDARRLAVSRQALPLFCVLFVAPLLGCADGGPGQSGQNAETWTQITVPGPSPRYAHIAVLDPVRHQIVLFGGVGGGPEVWIFAQDSRTWRAINPPGGPPFLASAAAVLDTEHDRMVIACGVSSPSYASSSVVNEVWSFSSVTQTWSSLPPGPSARWDLSAASDGKQAWFFGGFFPGLVATNELWQFDFSTDAWTLLPAGPDAPSPRTNSGVGFLSGFVYVTGGHDQAGLTPGTWRYNIAEPSWTEIETTGAPGAGAHFGYDVDKKCGTLLLAFGDHDDGIGVATTDVLTLSSPAEFSRLSAKNVPPLRRHAPLVFDPQTRTLLTFGGLQGNSTMLGDTWIYSRLNACSL